MPARNATMAAYTGMALLAFGAGPAGAALQYPARTITLIVPFAAGGPTDTVARIVAEPMARILGQIVVVENVVGAAGTTAAMRTAHAAADGYTIMMGHMGTHAAAVALNPKLPYDPVMDFEPIGMTAGMPILIVARKTLPPQDLREFVSYSQSNVVTMAHAGVGSVSYSACTMFNNMLGLKPLLRAYNGTAPAMSAMVGGQVDYMCDQIVTVVPQLYAGSIKAYAIASPSRSPALRNTPTTGEAGFPDLQASAWNALFAPRGTPAFVIETLNRALDACLDDRVVHNRLTDLGSELPVGDERTPAALRALVVDEIAKWKRNLSDGTALN